MKLQKYSFEGFFRHGSVKKELTGEMYIDKDGFFKTELEDHIYGASKKMFTGRVNNIGAISKLEFFTNPPLSTLPFLAYQLQKDVSNDFCGVYVGGWSTFSYKFESTNELGKNIVRFDTPISCNYAELQLFKK